MITSTADTKTKHSGPGPGNPPARATIRWRGRLVDWLGRLGVAGVLVAFCAATGPATRGTTAIGAWEPKFKGIDYSVSTNFPGGGDLPRLQVVHALRVDLQDPDVRLFTTPRLDNYDPDSGDEVGGLTVSTFLSRNKLQAAINANFFGPGGYYLPADTPMDIYGLAISEGTVVSAQTDARQAAVLLFDAQNRPTVIHTNWPAIDPTGFYTAVAGNYPLVIAGKNVIAKGSAFETDPRTVFGLSEDRRYLYLLAIDGRQPGYSVGANDYESAAWLLLLGAYEGINLDGGGSTTLVVEDTTGVPVRLNESSAVADSGRERTVGSHFGLYAKPIPGFINDVQAKADDTTATVRWTTIEPATSQVQYGTTPDLEFTSGSPSSSDTNHMVQLTGLTVSTLYYYRALSTAAGQDHLSPLYTFTTTNYVTTSPVFGVSNQWTFSTTPLTGLDWASPGYEDSSWQGPAPGLLWVDVRAAGPNPEVQPKNSVLPSNPATGFPYHTYYFRTHFRLARVPQSLSLTAYVDDGAIFYLNGTEAYRLRMPLEVTPETLAVGFPCDGDANCGEELIIPNNRMDLVQPGDNVLAVEVHNYDARSPDLTFGLALTAIEQAQRDFALEVRSVANALTLLWPESDLVLQSADDPAGPWIDLAAESPFTITPSGAHRYFRLRQ